MPLDSNPDEGIDAIWFTPWGDEKPMTWKGSLAANYTDGMLILHNGKIVYERYSGALREDGKHGAMSMTKSLASRSPTE